jgi:transmembrane sensor
MKTTDPAAESGSAPQGPARSVLDRMVDAGLAGELLCAVEGRRRRRRLRLLGGIGLASLVMLAVWQVSDSRIQPAQQAARGIVLQPQREILPDGTVAELKQGAAIRVDFSPAIRRVVLERGEVHFTVTKNPARPFVVSAGRLEVRAVGTAFAVDMGAQSVEVVVTEGRVAVESALAGPREATGAAALPTLVGAGERVLVDAAKLAGQTGNWPVDRLTAEEMAETQAWRMPRLEFSGTPLAEALPLFNQHSVVQLVLEDARMGELRISGIIRADNTDALLRLLEANFGIVAEQRRPGQLVLRHAR